jgi:hypothetical protein
MSNRYEASVASAAAPAAAAAFFELRNGSSRRLLVEEIGVTIGAATASGVALVRANAQGTGGATSATGQAEDAGQAASTATGVFVNAFTSAPTFTAANTMRRIRLPATIGAGIIWTWPQSDRLVVPASGSIVLYNNHSAAGSAATDIYVIWTE